MKSVLMAATLFFSLSMWGQTSAPPKDAAKPHDHKHATQAAKPEHDMHQMMTKCMESMKKQLPVAEKTLADMKIALGQMKTDDPAAKHLAELNLQMWEAEVAHMKEMAAMHDQMKSHLDSMHDHMQGMKEQGKSETKK